MNRTYTKVYERAIHSYGKDNQMRIAQEECAELIQALNKYHRYGKSKQFAEMALANVKEEMADVQIMLDQLQIIFGFTDAELEEARLSKIKRLAGNLPAEEK